MFEKRPLSAYWLIVLAVLGAYLPFLGATHLFDWDEVNFAECAREMLATGNYLTVQIDYHPFIEKPPFFFWFQAAALRIFGIGAFAARFPNVLVAVFTSIFLFYYAKKHWGARFGLLWLLVYHGSTLPFVYYKSGIIDPMYNALGFAAFLSLLDGLRERPVANGLWAGLLLGLAALTKGPAVPGLVVISFVLYAVLGRGNVRPASWQSISLMLARAGVLAFLVLGAWLAAHIAQHGTVLLEDFNQYQMRLLTTNDAGHKQPFYYHFVVVLLGCGPASYFALLALWKGRGRRAETENDARPMGDWMRACAILAGMVLLVFSLVQTKIVHYSSMAYLPLSLMAATYLWRSQLANKIDAVIIKAHLLILCTVIGVFYYAMQHKTALVNGIKGEFAKAALSGAVVPDFNLYNIIYMVFVLAAMVFFWRSRRRLLPRMALAALCHVLLLHYVLIFILPTAESISQRPMIDFIKDKRGQDCYVEVVGFKSYAHLFYFGLPPKYKPADYSTEWLMQGDIDRKAYFISKVDKHTALDSLPGIRFLGKGGGYTFYERDLPN
jgi:4-amino-4-deoxy-L-arabinose transferase-like glycosyltransferase